MSDSEFHPEEAISASSADDDNSEEQYDARDLLQEVFNAIGHSASKDVFAIGGKIDLKDSNDPDSVEQGPIVVRWDSGKWKQGRKVSLPVGDDADSDRAFQQLLKDCQAATFGKGKEEVLDEEYRKAGKMDTAQFCTDFNLAKHGIVNTVTQALVQGASGRGEYNGVIADLYKLNIYSCPSGKFKSHIDTPRSERQMGSLVVCLPYPHRGGALAVRHEGQEVLFDWSSEKGNSIQWAAFFSDCEHEVLEVTEGHRVTLTYNLYWTDFGPSLMATHLSILDQESLPFYAALKRLIECPSFLPNGGFIGFSCTHGYPHTSHSAKCNLQSTLKGLDMVVYQALERLVGSAKVVASVDGSDYERSTYEAEIDSDNGAGKFLASETYLSRLLVAPVLEVVYKGDTLNPASIKHTVSDNNGRRHQERAFPKMKVIWLNSEPQSFNELAVAFAAFGNEPSIDAYYSAAVIVSELGGYNDR